VRILLHASQPQPNLRAWNSCRPSRAQFRHPRKARLEPNPWKPTPDALKRRAKVTSTAAPSATLRTAPAKPTSEAISTREFPTCACRKRKSHRRPAPHIIRSGVPLTGMPGWAKPHDEQSDDSWKLVLYIRSLRT